MTISLRWYGAPLPFTGALQKCSTPATRTSPLQINGMEATQAGYHSEGTFLHDASSFVFKDDRVAAAVPFKGRMQIACFHGVFGSKEARLASSALQGSWPE